MSIITTRVEVSEANYPIPDEVIEMVFNDDDACINWPHETKTATHHFDVLFFRGDDLVYQIEMKTPYSEDDLKKDLLKFLVLCSQTPLDTEE